MIIIEILSRTESSLTIIAYMGIFLGMFLIAPVLWVWQSIGFQTLGWMLLIGLLGSIAQIVISQSFKELIPQLSSRQAVHPSPPTALGIISID
ncbi:hypothetical protein N9D61_07585 [Planktomarina sp.]|nr:hypothetical protein [Planktomarina sp.]